VALASLTPDLVVAFGSYQLDRSSGRLLCGGAAVPLRPKAFAVLEHLVTHPGRLISPGELLDAVWPNTHVTPSALTGCIRELRRALGDDARAAQFIETAYRRGYRFIAAPPAAPPIPAAAPAARTRPIRALTRDSELADLARRFAGAIAAVLARGPHPRPSRSRARAGHARSRRRRSARRRARGHAVRRR